LRIKPPSRLSWSDGRKENSLSGSDCFCLSSPSPKKISLFFQGKSVALSVRPVPQEGRFAIVTNVGSGCGGRGSVVTRICAWTNDAIADGEVVWSGGPDAGVKSAMMSGVFLGITLATVTIKPGHRGEHEGNR
jgi:hypothetical protein